MNMTHVLLEAITKVLYDPELDAETKVNVMRTMESKYWCDGYGEMVEI